MAKHPETHLGTRYRKRRGLAADSWHFCRNCRHWPAADYIEQIADPAQDELCAECLGKEQARECQI